MEQAQKIRKKWLTMMLANMMAVIFGAMIILYKRQWLLENDPNLKAVAIGITVFLILLFCIVFSWTIYHCAYKKRGTKLLTLHLALTPIFIYVGYQQLLSSSDLPFQLIFALSLCISYWYECLQLYALNKTYKEPQSMVSDEAS